MGIGVVRYYGAAELKRFQWLMGWIGLLTLLPLIAGGNDERRKWMTISQNNRGFLYIVYIKRQ